MHDSDAGSPRILLIGPCDRIGGKYTGRWRTLPGLVAHLRRQRTLLRNEWARRIHDARLLTAMSEAEIFREATALYDRYVAVLATGSVNDLQAYARAPSKRIIQRGVETHEVLGIVLLLRDVLARSLFKKYRNDVELLSEPSSHPVN